jgi:hypothetical protein
MMICSDFIGKEDTLPTAEFAKLKETQLMESEIENIDKVNSLKARQIEDIYGIYSGIESGEIS